MSKLSLVALIACAVSIPSAMAFDLPGGGGNNPTATVHFNGYVFTNSCRVENQNVKLSNVLNKKINKNTPQQLQDFSITVTDCDTNGNQAPVLSWLPRSAIITSEGYLQNKTPITGPGNVALALQSNKGEPILLNQTQRTFNPDISTVDTNALTYSFKVGYIKTGYENFHVRPGPVTASVSYSISYP